MIALYNSNIFEHDLSASLLEIQQGNIESGLENLKTMSERHYIDSELREQLLNLSTIIQIQCDVVSRDFTLSTSEKEILKEVRSNDPCGLGIYANNLLVTYSNEESIEFACAEERDFHYSITGNESSSIQLYPNPTSADFCILKLNYPGQAEANIEIYSAEGRFIMNQKISEGQMEIPIDLSQLKSGMYFLAFNVGGESHNLKLIKE